MVFPRGEMYNSKSLRPHVEHDSLLSCKFGTGDSTETWQPHEELVVSDVFTPQAPDHEDHAENKSEDRGCAANGITVRDAPTTGFKLCTPELSPSRFPQPNRKDAARTAKHLDPEDSIKKTRGRGGKKRRDAGETLGVTTVRGFNPPNSCAGTDSSQPGSAYNSPRLQPSANGGVSPNLRPTSSNGGVSALKFQLDSLNLSDNKLMPGASKLGTHTPSCASVASDSDETDATTSYEVPLEHDFVSSDANCAESVPNDREQLSSMICRKMTAADFQPLICLGKGAYGTVLLVRHNITGALYAQKHFRKASLTVHKKLVEQTKTERAILESVNRHPFVVKLYYAFQDQEKLYLILEYAQGGELFTHLAMERMFSEDVASFYMAEMVLALEHLHHDVGVVYRDLKPENCLLDADGHLLLTDFGLSKVAVDGEDRCNSSLGTIEYMAPEVIQAKSYGKACDWWSLGALGFDLLTGSPPFKANNHSKIREKILKQKLVLPYFLTPDAKDLLTRLLRKEPKKRLGYNMPKDMQTIKKHRFFRKIDWKALERRELEPPIKPLVTDPASGENFSLDFTSLPLSPKVSTKIGPESHGEKENSSGREPSGIHSSGSVFHDDPFGGFSFVASSSLLDGGRIVGR